MASPRSLSPGLKLLLDIGPLALFFIAYGRFGIFAATAAFMVAVVAALLVAFARTGRWPIMPALSAVIVLVFGGLTLVLQDETFIKLKPTILYGLFGAVLAAGLAFDRPLLAFVFDTVFDLTDEGWRKLSARWAAFFFVLAGLNELIWRTQSTDFWVNFKLFGFVPLTLAFAALQVRLVARYARVHPAPQVEPHRPANESAETSR